MRDCDLNVALNLAAMLEEQSESLARAAKDLKEAGFGQPVTNRTSNAVVTLAQIVAQLARYEVLAPPTPGEMKAQHVLDRVGRLLESEASDGSRITWIASEVALYGAWQRKMNGMDR